MFVIVKNYLISCVIIILWSILIFWKYFWYIDNDMGKFLVKCRVRFYFKFVFYIVLFLKMVCVCI